MAYSQGSIVWYRKAPGDSEISYAGSEPCAATVTTVHAADLADLTIMVNNQTAVVRLGVPLIAAGQTVSGHFATATRA